MLGVFRIPLDECDRMYRQLGSDVFRQNVILGAVKMGWSHAFYDSGVWESILKSVPLLLLFSSHPPLYRHLVVVFCSGCLSNACDLNVMFLSLSLSSGRGWARD